MLVLSGCGGGGSGSVFQQYRGTEGLSIVFMKNAPAASVYEDRPFPVRVEVHNKGATNVDYNDMRLTFSYDPLYIGGGKTPYDPRDYDFDNTGIEGRSIYYREGQKTTFIMPSDAAFFAKKILGQRESPDTDLTASVCYSYTTSLGADVCIDTNIYQENERAQSCKQEDLTFSGGQGAPIAVTKVETRSIPLYDRETRAEMIKPEFLITIKDVGGGYLVGPDTLPLESACLLKSIPREQLSAVRVRAWLLSTELVCGNTALTKEAGIVRLYEGTAEVSCTVPQTALSDAVFSATQNFQSTLQVNISYIYKASAKMPISIERTPGTVYDEFPSWMTQRATGATYLSTAIETAVRQEKSVSKPSGATYTPAEVDATLKMLSTSESYGPAIVQPPSSAGQPSDSVPDVATTSQYEMPDIAILDAEYFSLPESRTTMTIVGTSGATAIASPPTISDGVIIYDAAVRNTPIDPIGNIETGTFIDETSTGSVSGDAGSSSQGAAVINIPKEFEKVALTYDITLEKIKSVIPPGYTLSSSNYEPEDSQEDPGYDLGSPEEPAVFDVKEEVPVPTMQLSETQKIEDVQIVNKDTGEPLEMCEFYAHNPEGAPDGVRDYIRGYSCSCTKTQCDAAKDSKKCFTGLCTGSKYCCAPSAVKVPVTTVKSSLIKDPRGDVLRTIDNINKYRGLMETIRSEAVKNNVDPDLMVAIFTQESGGNPLIINSQSGCAGIGQFEYSTAKQYKTIFGDGLRSDCRGVCGTAARCIVSGTKCASDPRFDPYKSAKAAPLLFADKIKWLKRYHDFDDEVRVGLAAYNGGEGLVLNAIRKTGKVKPNWDDISAAMDSTVVLQAYCKKGCDDCAKVCIADQNGRCCLKYWSTESARANKAKEVKQYVERIMTYYAALDPSPEAIAKAPASVEDTAIAAKKSLIATSAAEEWAYFNQGTKNECDEAVVDRVNEYYSAGRCDPKSTCKAVPWSAAFISYVMKDAGVNFPYNCAHWNYFTAIRDNPTRYSCKTAPMSATSSLQPGDVVCACREGGCPTTYDMPAGQRNTHCDVVVDVTPTAVTVIGGNMGDTVKRRTISKSTLSTSNSYYGIIQCA